MPGDFKFLRRSVDEKTFDALAEFKRCFQILPASCRRGLEYDFGGKKNMMCILISYQKLNLFIFTRFATSVPHREILFQNDAYTARGTVQLRVNEFGVFYVFVDIDRYNRVSVC